MVKQGNTQGGISPWTCGDHSVCGGKRAVGDTGLAHRIVYGRLRSFLPPFTPVQCRGFFYLSNLDKLVLVSVSTFA